jgi:hypothetical protein
LPNRTVVDLHQRLGPSLTVAHVSDLRGLRAIERMLPARNALNARLRLNGSSDRSRVIAGDSSNYHPMFSLTWCADVDAAFEEGAITNGDALCSHIPSQRTFTPDVHTVAGIDVAAHLGQNHHFTGSDIRRHLCIPAHRGCTA